MKVKKRTLINLFNLFLISLISLIVAFRGNTRDTELYFGVFKNINRFSLDPTFLFIYLSTNLLKIRFIDVLFFYLPNLFITQQLMQIRQGLASAIVINVIILLYCYQKKIKSSLLLLCAMSIHSVSIAYLIFFLPQIKN